MRIVDHLTLASHAIAVLLLADQMTAVSAVKLPKCAKQCLVPDGKARESVWIVWAKCSLTFFRVPVCTRRNFCSTSCFGNCLVPPSSDAPIGCSAAMDQQLLLKACQGQFEGLTTMAAATDSLMPKSAAPETTGRLHHAYLRHHSSQIPSFSPDPGDYIDDKSSYGTLEHRHSGPASV